ncbi:hypothetical protein E2C01_010584 [Portunus trituberculatus]|uniref:Uncharacterized protein n=1 Tax=Portunus trituberculatus TaxID=210409 RepID=A0A5B7D8S3_PORTR|nr:hypothetical protein [Portunus trituberculatus]
MPVLRPELEEQQGDKLRQTNRMLPNSTLEALSWARTPRHARTSFRRKRKQGISPPPQTSLASH